MSDAAATTTGALEAPSAETTTPPADPAPTDLGDAGKRALEAERKAKRDAERRAAEAEARVKEFEDSQKSELEKAAARAEAAEKAAAEAQAKALRLEIAEEMKVPSNLRRFLTGTDEDSLREQAESLVNELAAAMEASRTTPRPDVSQGAKPANAADIDTQIAEATKAGNHALAISLKRQKAYAPTT